MQLQAVRIGVIGGSNPPEEIIETAKETGRLIAKAGAILVCGGLGGVMEAVSKGAKEEGGLTIGILPGQNRKDANRYIDIALATGLGYSRNILVVLNSDALIAIDGSYGTLSEISYALIYKKPLFGLETWKLYQNQREDKRIVYCSSPQEAVQKAIQSIK